MGLSKYRIGDLIEPFSKKCGISDLQPNDVSGINIDKEFFEPAKQVGEDTCGYKIVPPNYFACNLMHVGRDEVLPVALNHSGHNKIVSPAYSVFRIKNEDIVMKEYFFILLKSSEKDRYFWFHTDSSIRQGLPWEDFCDIDITLPSIEQQRKYVDVYLSLQNNLATYQSKVDDLKLVCDGYIEDLRRKMPCEKIGSYIRECNERNEELSISEVQGVESSGNFSETRANTVGLDFHNYKIVRPYQFAYNPSRINLGSIAMRDALSTDCIVSPMYVVFEVVEHGKLLPDYLLLWLTRSEFFRSTLFYASGSVRDTFGFSEMKEVEIPIPNISVQREIVNIHRCYIERQRIAAKLKEQLNNLCPILIKGSLQN
jgi:type I restriction enzyme S subunit